MDYIGYSASGSETYTTSYGVTQIFDLNGVTGDFEISATLKGSTSENAFGITFNTHNGTQNNNLLRVGFGTNSLAIVSKVNNTMTDNYWNTENYQADTPITLKIKRVNGEYTCYAGENLSHSIVNAPSGLRYVMLESWNFARTISYTDFKVERM